MSKDGYLPDNVNESDLPGESGEHYKTCPAHPDAPVIYSECGNDGECLCEDDNCEPLDLECECADIAADIAEAKADAREDK